MNNQNDAIAIILANRHYLYELLKHVFGNEPNLELMDILTNEHTKEAIELTLEEDDNNLGTYLDLLTELRRAMSTDAGGILDKMKSEYTYLMIGPNKLPAPPWESVYRTKERLLFQECTLIVRRAYLKYQFLPSNYPHEADDHIALELDFMAHLAKLTLECFENNGIEEVKRLLADQKSFLDEHLLVWIDQFADQIQNSRTHYFYPQIALLTKQLIRIDADVIDKLVNLLEQ